ncbi:hypothetical protein AGOR_G00051940 [Albula goreensis]|uniref:Uncharacterized protein n=1 Tax=Albula goreensis TaxID=1534307 RepID=A0A8T3DXS7_9TELE|nr:hypothetical protein AGOR_G00051940 [Albula goreensis]
MLPEGDQTEMGENVKEGKREETRALGPIRVSVELQYQLGERTETHLNEMGATCVGEVILTDMYYDTESFELAAQQTWLSRQGSQWRLILNQMPCPSVSCGDEVRLQRLQAEMLITDAGQGVGAGSGEGDMGVLDGLRGTTFPKTARTSETREEQKVQPQFPSTAPWYCELTANNAIVEHLARCLQVALTEEEGGTMSVEHFVELAGIQSYGNWTVSRRLEYRLPDTCTLEVRKDYSNTPYAHSAVLTMGADVLDIGHELEKMESLAAELELQPRPT